MYYINDMVSIELYYTCMVLKQANCVSYLSGHHDKTFEISHLREERFVWLRSQRK